jgi:hypothetical protein
MEGISMPTVKTKIHQKVDEAEIALVLQCRDSHEFYEKYLQAFPKKRKGIESISKIWKRRSEFVKKQQQAEPQEKPATPAPQDFRTLLALQHTQMTELCAIAKEQLQISREILATLKKQSPQPEEQVPKRRVTGITIQPEPVKKEQAKKKILAKPAPILIGS